MKRLFLAVVLLCMVYEASCTEYRLWYDRPAMTWTQALPVGNGVIGGMVYGTPAVEHIQINEETIWAGQPNQVTDFRGEVPRGSGVGQRKGDAPCSRAEYGYAVSAIR